MPLEDWIDFKNRTKDVKPLDKFVAKLRATYDFLFHKSENVTNVEKILGKAAEELDDMEKNINFTRSMVTDRFEDSFDKLETLDEALPLEHLEIVDETVENNDPALSRSNFHLPYTIVEAIFRWLIALYYSASSPRENA